MLQCFFPQNMAQQIRTPLFIVNAAYDSWQVSTLLWIKKKLKFMLLVSVICVTSISNTAVTANIVENRTVIIQIKRMALQKRRTKNENKSKT